MDSISTHGMDKANLHEYIPQSKQNDDGVEIVIKLEVKLLASLDIQSATATRAIKSETVNLWM